MHEKRKVKSDTTFRSILLDFTKSKIIPAAHIKNVELVSVLIGGSHDSLVGHKVELHYIKMNH